MAWMPWNVHYFVLEWYKAYSFTLQFAISTINILIIDVNLAHVKKKKKSKSGVEFVPAWGVFLEKIFTVWTVFYPDPQGLLSLSPCGLIFVLMQYCIHSV